MRVGSGSPVRRVAVLLAVLSAGAAGAVVPIGLTTNANLTFGQTVATPTAGLVTVSPQGARSASGGAVLGSAFGVSAASFTVTGDANADYSITLPSSCTLTGAGSSMSADGFTSSLGGSGNLGPGGSQIVTVGATLHVGAHQAQASYSGTYVVTVAYP